MTLPANQQLLADLSTALAELTAKAAPGVVAVRSNRSRSSGLVWRAGLIVTADDPLPDDGEFSVTLSDGTSVAATLAGRDPTTDIALLRVDRSDLQVMPLATVATRTGALAIVVGNDDGRPTAAVGAVALASGGWRSMRGGEIDARIELDVALRRSAEGGLVLDASGQALGMSVFGPRGRVLVIPSATIERVAARLESHGRIARGYIGLGLQTVAVDGDKPGTMVMSVDPKGPAAAAGIQQGDILTSWGGQPIRNVQTLVRMLGPDTVGNTVRVDLSRAGAARQVSLTVAEKPLN
jgi:S1-C subfamily serine protease